MSLRKRVAALEGVIEELRSELFHQTEVIEKLRKQLTASNVPGWDVVPQPLPPQPARPSGWTDGYR